MFFFVRRGDDFILGCCFWFGDCDLFLFFVVCCGFGGGKDGKLIDKVGIGDWILELLVELFNEVEEDVIDLFCLLVIFFFIIIFFFRFDIRFGVGFWGVDEERDKELESIIRGFFFCGVEEEREIFLSDLDRGFVIVLISVCFFFIYSFVCGCRVVVFFFLVLLFLFLIFDECVLFVEVIVEFERIRGFKVWKLDSLFEFDLIDIIDDVEELRRFSRENVGEWFNGVIRFEGFIRLLLLLGRICSMLGEFCFNLVIINIFWKEKKKNKIYEMVFNVIVKFFK